MTRRLSFLGVLVSLFLLFASAWTPADEPIRYSTAPPARVFALLVFDTNASRIGEAIKIDQENLVSTIKNKFEKSDKAGRLFLTVLSGADVTREKILKFLEDLKGNRITTPNDTVFFYYSGHGGFTREKGHFLALNSGFVPRKDITDVVWSMPFRLALTITDSCAVLTEMGETKPRETAYRPSPHPWTLVDNLFFESRGIVDINSSRPGKPSKVHPKIGSFFTFAFNATLQGNIADIDDNRDGRASWQETLNAVNREVDSIQRNIPIDEQQQVYAFQIRVGLDGAPGQRSPRISGRKSSPLGIIARKR